MDDEILIVDDEKVDSNRIKQGWKVLIVDDEPEVHRITKMTLAKFEFDNKPIEFIHAYTGHLETTAAGPVYRKIMRVAISPLTLQRSNGATFLDSLTSVRQWLPDDYSS